MHIAILFLFFCFEIFTNLDNTPLNFLYDIKGLEKQSKNKIINLEKLQLYSNFFKICLYIIIIIIPNNSYSLYSFNFICARSNNIDTNFNSIKHK